MAQYRTCTGVICVVSLRVVVVLNMEMVSIVNISDQPQVPDGDWFCYQGHASARHAQRLSGQKLTIAQVLRKTCPCIPDWVESCSCEDTGCWEITQTGGVPCKTCECHAIIGESNG